jgi:hypothetical protein
MRHVYLSGFFLAAVLSLVGCHRTTSIDKVLKTTDDFEVCDELYKLMVKHYGDDFDISKCKDADRTVILVWHASGIIDNGGFQYLFEGNFKGDPHFAKTGEAFKTIGATKCAEAIQEALDLFPQSKPPANADQRLKLYQAVSQEKREAIDKKFFSESKEIKVILAAYIREHREAFKHLK